jgi:hypothetical protein
MVLCIVEEMPIVVDTLPIVVGALGGGEVTKGTIGIVGAGAPVVGATAMVGTAAAELTPRLLISVESSGMPVRPTPPGVSGGIGVDEAATLTEPEPHMPDRPDVLIMAEVVGMPEAIAIADDDEVAAIDIGLEPVAGAAMPSDVPPPSKVAVDPNIVEGDVPIVVHPALAAVLVEAAGAGLTPGDAISVAPSGIPVPPTGAVGTMPSGEVADSDGVGVTAACAKAGLVSSGQAAATTRRRFMTRSVS